MDVTDPGSVANGLEEARIFAAPHGGIEWLVNNAGAAESVPLERSDDVLAARMM